jgi:hypothetical protein
MTRDASAIPARHEHKYLLTMGQAAEVRRRIAPFCALDASSAASPTGRYVITSLYLDTPHLGFFRATELRAHHRIKLRVRRYGENVGDSAVFLESKERTGDIIQKRRAPVEPGAWLACIQEGTARAPLEKDFAARCDRYRVQPALLVRYEREAWRGAFEAYVRVTFDERLQFQATDRWSLEDDGGGFTSADDPVAMGENDPRVVLEVKFEREVPRWLAGAMRDLELVRRGMSKYGTGVKRTYAASMRLDAARREASIFGSF